MKKITTLIALVIISLTLTIDASASQLILRTVPASQASANIAGNHYFSPRGDFQIQNLGPGSHFLSVTDEGRYRNHRGETNHRRSRIIFNGRVFIPTNSIVYARITPRGDLVIERTVHIVPQRKHYHQPTPNRHHDVRPPVRRGPPPPQHRNPRVYREMGTSSSINNVMRLMDEASFESEKLAIAKQYVNANLVRSEDVLRMMRNLDFESSKLSLAKYAYKNTADQNNYFMVNEAFDFSSSVNALRKYID